MKIAVCMLFILASLHLCALADDTLSDDAAFDSGVFDSAFAQGIATDDKNKLEYLPGLFFVSETNGLGSGDESGYGVDTRFYGKAFLKATKGEVGQLFIGCNYNYFLFAGASSERFRTLYRMQSPDPGRITASLSEIHFAFDIKKRVFIRLGKQLIGWGPGYFWSPEDFINLQKSQPSVINVVDVRSGKPGLRLHIPILSANLFLFTDFSAGTANTTARPLSEIVAQAWRLDGTIAGVNLGTVGYISRNGPANIGFDATGKLYATDIYGEAAFSFLQNSGPVASAFSIGASRPWGQEKNWTGRGEFYYNDTGFSDTRISALPFGSFIPFYSGKYYSYLEITGINLFSRLFNCTVYGFVNLADFSYSPTLQGTFTLPRLAPISLFVRYFGGKDDREFTSRYGQGAWQGGLRIVIEL